MKITAFIPYNGENHTLRTVESLLTSEYVSKIVLLSGRKNLKPVDGCKIIEIRSLFSSETIKLISEAAEGDYIIFVKQDNHLDFGQFSIERFANIARNTGAGLVYSDYFEIKNNVRTQHPVIDYQIGSLRDDFNFGYAYFFDTALVKKAVAETAVNYSYAGLYNLRLKISQYAPIVRIPEYLYSTIETDIRKSGEKQFDYVDPKNRELQLEMEEAVSDHLKKIGAFLEPDFLSINTDEASFEFEASVIIPVRNRVKTIADAIESVLRQKTDFKFNLIVVDNYSDDGTGDKIKEFVQKDSKVIHLVPGRTDLAIGGCWNEGVHHPACGKFAVQLDSDDMYSDENTLQRIIDTFRKEKCAMVIGSYKITNFNLEVIPPGLIDHKEWTPDNGRNNALRINGLGAPRAFYTPILRKYKIPNVSYGEDYALGLMISRDYQIGRIYESIYLCRRWEGNSDAELDILKLNAHNLYKDRIRSFEVMARQRKNKYA
ncbi:MAG: glycosyltransferase family 2 protein [Melioribacteraceae bacterium]|nr:glycosyltransferase family 2 protein [Melioribacteraceae bacterium]